MTDVFLISVKMDPFHICGDPLLMTGDTYHVRLQTSRRIVCKTNMSQGPIVFLPAIFRRPWKYSTNARDERGDKSEKYVVFGAGC